jgi:small GTP-binding protein
MTNIVLEGPIAQLREREVRLLVDLAEQVGKFGEEAATDRDRLRQNADDLRDMFFLVVVVGEFNAGKSTFVNALMGDSLLPTGITPTTEVIEMIRYAPQPSREPVMKEGDSVREWGHPNTGGPGVVIVDTPGTGSVFSKHERIAKNFLSRSDLVLFLLSAKRAFAQTEKLYLEMARDYGKKIILVINQIDLLEKKEQKEVMMFVKQQVSELLQLDPPMFTVSAKKAFQKRSGGLFAREGVDESGMDVIRDYLAEMFKRIPPAKQKLLAQMDFVDSLLKKYTAKVDDKLRLVGADHAYVEQLNEELTKQAGSLAERLGTTMSELDRIFDGLLGRGRTFVNSNLTLGKNLFRSPDKDKLREKFEKEVVGNAIEQISDLSEDYVSAVVDSSRRYWRGIIDRLSKLEALMKQDVSAPDAGSYAEQRTALQEAIAIADHELKSYTEHNIAESLRETFAENMFGFTISLTSILGGIIAFLLSASASGPIIGAGATALATIGGAIIAPALAVGGTAGALVYGRKLRRDAVKELETRLQTLRESYRQSLVNMTDRERTRLLNYGQQILAPVFSQLDVLSSRYKDQKLLFTHLNETATTLHEAINKLQVTEHITSA